MKFSRNTIFVLGMLVIAAVYSIERARFVIGAKQVTGKFVFNIEEVVNNERVVFPIIEYVETSRFTQKDTVYQFRAKEDTHYIENEEVPVLLLNEDPDNPKLYTFGSFWLFPVVYYVLPILLWAAFCFSYIDRPGRRSK